MRLFGTLIFTFVVLIGIGGQLKAAHILQPVGAATEMGSFRGSTPDRVVNKSGLSITYTSLVDDFVAYIASNPIHDHGSGDNVWGSPMGVRSGYFDLDLGGSHMIRSMAFWNAADDPSAVKDFNLMVDDDPTFGSPTILGSFTASDSVGSNPNTGVEVFRFAPTMASFVRLDILNTWSPSSFSMVFGEMAFEVVPEPTTLRLAGAGLFGIAFRIRKRSIDGDMNDEPS